MAFSIGPVGPLVCIIQSQLAMRTMPGKAAKQGAISRKPLAAGQDQQAKLEAFIIRRLQGIEPDDPNRGRKAFRAFLESVFLIHFGEQLANDAAFHQLVGKVDDGLHADPTLRPLIETAIQHLLQHT